LQKRKKEKKLINKMWNFILLILFFGITVVISFNSFHKKENIALLSIIFVTILSIIILTTPITPSKEILMNELYNLHEKIVNLNDESIRAGSKYTDKIKMPVYYINLEKSTERNEFIQTQMKKYGIQGNRIGGIYGKDLVFEKDTIQLTDDKNIEFINTFTSASPGELGCTLSHIKAIYTAFRNNDEHALIIEDDASFVLYPHWPVDLYKIMSEAPKDWNIISLYSDRKTKNKYTICSASSGCGCPGTVAYIINRKGMENVISDILTHNLIDLRTDKFPLTDWTDDDYYIGSDFLIYYKSGKTYLYSGVPTIIAFNADDLLDSTIHTSHTSGHIENSLNAVKKYLIETKDVIFIRKTWSSETL